MTGAEGGGFGLRRKAVEILTLRVVSMPIAFATTVITSRTLLPEGRGAYVLGLLTVTLAATLLANGTAVTHEVGRRPDDVAAVVRKGLILNLALATVSVAVLVPLNLLFAGEYPSTQLFVLGLPALLTLQTVGGALLAVGRVRLWGLLQLIAPALTLVGLLILVSGAGLKVAGAVLAWLIGTVAAAVVALVAARDTWAPGALRTVPTRPMVRLAVAAGVVNLVALVNYRIALMILELFRGLDAVGIYSVAMSLAELLWVLSATVTTVVVAPAIRLDDEGAALIVSRSVRHTLLLVAGAGIVLGTVGSYALPIVFGEPFRPSITPLLLLIPGVVAYAPSSVLSAYFSMRLGRMRVPLAAAGTSAITTAVLCIVLVPAFGVAGTALATSLGYLAGSSLLITIYIRTAHRRPGELVPGLSDLLVYRDLPRSLLGRHG